MRLPDSVVGDARTSDFGWSVLEALVDVGDRMAGQEGEAAGARIVRDAFADAGLREVAIDEFDVPGWWRGSASLAVLAPHERTHDGQQDVLALPGSPAGTVEGPVVDVGDGTYEAFEAAGDLDGAVVLASSATPEGADRWLHRMEKYVNAVEGGAAGFLFRNHVEGALPPTGEVGYHDRPGAIPAVGVSKEVGARLARYAESAGEGDESAGAGGTTDDPARVRLDVDCRNAPATSRNVEAAVGPETDEAVLVTAHVDAHDISDGANDNGAGSAMVAEVGRLLGSVAGDLDVGVRLVTFGAEESGLWGAYHWAETHDLDDVRCVVNLDGACSSRTVKLITSEFEGVERAFRDATDALAAPLEVDETISPHGDQWAFAQEGVPAVMASTASESSGRGWGHTHADTLDKLDPRDFREVVTVVAEAVARLASDDYDVPRRTRAEMRDAIDEGYEQELRKGGRWPYEE